MRANVDANNGDATALIDQHIFWETTMKIATRRQPAYKTIALLCGAIAMGTVATAQGHDLLAPDIAVHYGDLAIDTEQGATQLLKRIEGAAGRVCSRLDRGTLDSRANVSACRQKLEAAAVSEVNQPMLLAVYNSSRSSTTAMARLEK